MRAGLLRHRVTLQQRVVTLSASGAAIETWPDVVALWAQVSPGKGSKQELQDQVDAPQSVRVRMRYRAGVDTSYRVEFRGRVYEIEAATNWEERGIFLDLDCILRAADGFRGAK